MKKTQIVHNLIMVTHEFGAPVYIAPAKDFKTCITDKKQDAEMWSEFDRTKIAYHKSVTGYKGLKFETI